MSLLRTPPEEAVVVPPAPAARAKEFARLTASPRGSFFAAIAVLYASAILLTTLTLNTYFAQTWDVATFIHAARGFLDGGSPFDLYAQSRAAQTWPYAYPPLHALTVAVALLIGDRLPILPEYVWARVPAMLADIGIALLLYRIVERHSEDPTFPRLAALMWLFNPVTYYDTAVQGHFESEWLFFVLLAYAWYEQGRGALLSTLALAIAVLFKQVAILFAIPFWAMLWLGTADGIMQVGRRQKAVGRNRLLPSALCLVPTGFRSGLWSAVGSLLLFALVVGAACLPYLLYSNDFLYMNLTYVENVPVQTQSWLIAILGLTRAAPDALSSDFFLLRYQAVVTLLATLGIGAFAARRGWSLYLAAALVALAFFLTSKKVMGYYYVMLFPFLLASQLPQRRFRLIALALVATAWIALSPYYASWTDHSHWWIYALLGTLNSLFFVWMSVQLARENAEERKENPRTGLIAVVGLFAAAVLAALLQPVVSNATSPIRAPILPPGYEGNGLFALVMLVAPLAAALPFLRWWARPAAAAWGIVLIFVPLFFAVYTLTKESTAIFEIALKSLGG